MISKDWLESLHAAAHAVVALRLGVFLEHIEGHEYSYTENRLRELDPETIILKNPFEDVLFEQKDGADKLMTVLSSTAAIGTVLGVEGLDNEADLRSMDHLKAFCASCDIELDPIETYTAKAMAILQKPENRILVIVIADRLMKNDTLWMQHDLMLMRDYPAMYEERKRIIDASFDNDCFEWEIQTAGYQLMSACLGLDVEHAMHTLKMMVQDGSLDVWGDAYESLDTQRLESLLLIYFAGHEAFNVMGVGTVKADVYLDGAQVIVDRARAHGLCCDSIDVYRQKTQAIFNDQKNKFVLHLLLGYFIMGRELLLADADGITSMSDSRITKHLLRTINLDAEKSESQEQEAEKMPAT